MRTRHILTGLAAAAAIIAPVALAASSAEAVTTKSTAADCTPIVEKAAVAEVHHTEYKYVPVVGTGHVRWSTASAPTKNFDGVAYKAEYDNKGLHKTQIVIDSPAAPAVDGVTCVIALPANPLTGLNGISQNTAIPTPAGTEKYTFSPVVNHINLDGKIGTTVTAKPGYVFAYGTGFLASKVFAATPDNTGFVFVNGVGTQSKQVNLPDVFKDTRDFDGHVYAFTQVTRTIVNETDNDLVVNVANADQQDGNQIWVERTVFDNSYHQIVIPAHSSKVVTFDVWYDVADFGADVPDDLTLDFAVEAKTTWE